MRCFLETPGLIKAAFLVGRSSNCNVRCDQCRESEGWAAFSATKVQAGDTRAIAYDFQSSGARKADCISLTQYLCRLQNLKEEVERKGLLRL